MVAKAGREKIRFTARPAPSGDCAREPASIPSPAMFKLLALIATVAWFALWYARKARGRERMREIDEGRRCVACDGTNVDAHRGIARCLRCGHTVSLAGFRSARVSDQELDNVTKPDDNRPRF
jgi:hypothetical protein